MSHYFLIRIVVNKLYIIIIIIIIILIIIIIIIIIIIVWSTAKQCLLLLPTLSNQERELHEDTVLSAWGTHRAGSCCFGTHTRNSRTGNATNSFIPCDSLYYKILLLLILLQTGQSLKYTQKKEAKKSGSKKKREELAKCGDMERRRGSQAAKMDRK